MGEPGIRHFEAMWTHEKADWQLWPGRRGTLTPVRPGDPPAALLIEDENLAREVVARMISAGVRVVSEPVADPQPPSRPIRLSGPSVGGTGEAALVRTDYSDQQAWTQLLEAALAETDEGFAAYLTIVEGPGFEGLDSESVRAAMSADYPFSFVLIADASTMTNGEHPVLVVDLADEPGRTFRAAPQAVQGIENNLSLANMSFFEFADHVDSDGVFRGFLP